MRVVTIGTSYVDIKGFPSGTFIPAGRNAGRIEQVHGGVARNIAEDIAHMGIDSVLLSLVDDTGIGMDVIAHLKEQGICTDYIKAVPGGLGMWLAVFDDKGDVCANVSARTDMTPLCDILDAEGDELIGSADGVLIEMDLDECVMKSVFELAAKHGIGVYGVISNMTIASKRLEYIKQCACFVCNKQEAGQLFETDTSALDAGTMQRLLSEKITEMGIPCMIVTLGGDGAVYAAVDGRKGFCPAQKTQVVDTTGAGDSFFAGASVILIGGGSLDEACMTGTKLASKVISSTSNVY